MRFAASAMKRRMLCRSLARISMAFVAGSLRCVVACDKTDKALFGAPPAPASAASTPAPVASTLDVTILVTVDENGALLPRDDTKKGGAAQIFGVWKAEDRHSSGNDSSTLVLSTGNHWNGAGNRGARQTRRAKGYLCILKWPEANSPAMKFG
jgi:hypothetical protein